MNNLKIFENKEFGTIRTIEIDGEVWFVGKDIAEALGYANISRDINRHVDEEDRKTEMLPQYQNGTLVSKTLIINESGLYSLILSSKLPKAKKFKHWVTGEVLPSIRTNGGYIAGQEKLNDNELIAKALQVASKIIDDKQKQINDMKPKVLFADCVSASNNTILIGELAKILRGNGVEIGQNRLFAWLRENGYLIRRTGTDYNMPTQRSMELGLFKIKETVITHSDGHTSISKTTKVTGKGQQYFINLFLSNQKVEVGA